jgi:hypothetical protein
VVLTWDSGGPGDNQTISPLSRPRGGRGKTIEKQEWSVFVISSRQDADPARRLEGLAILDAVADIVTDRQIVDGFAFSSPAGAYIVGRERWAVQPGMYVYRLRLQTTGSRTMLDGRTFSPWLRTRLDVPTTDDPPLPLVRDNEFTMPQ